MEYNKYYNEGWGLTKNALKALNEFIPWNEIKNVVEFGSGLSTIFLTDMVGEKSQIYSFDHSTEYSYKGDDSRVKLKIVDLVQCDDEAYETCFAERKLKLNNFYPATEIHSRMRNGFYKIESRQLPRSAQLIILDGPHGNGRSLAFPLIYNLVKAGTYVFIDDVTHYDFENRLKSLFEVEEVYRMSVETKENVFEKRGNFVLFKILAKI